MQVESPDKIRNLAITGHSDTGKTTLVSSLLYASGVVNRMNRVEDGNTLTDFDAEEIERGISIGLSVVHLPWKQHKLNLIDCPGYSIFFAETRSAVRAADAVLLCINAVSGLEVTAEKTWALAAEQKLPVLIHLTKMDRERADFEADLEKLRESLGREVVAVQAAGRRGARVHRRHRPAQLQAVSLRARRRRPGQAAAGPRGDARTGRRPGGRASSRRSPRPTTTCSRSTSRRASSERKSSGRRCATRCWRARSCRSRSAPARTASAPRRCSTTWSRRRPRRSTGATFRRPTSPASRSRSKTALDEPASALVFKTLSDAFTGKVSLIRVVSGELSTDSHPWNSREDVEERTTNLMEIEGKQSRATPRLIAGDIGGVAKLKHARYRRHPGRQEPAGQAGLDARARGLPSPSPSSPSPRATRRRSARRCTA